MTWLRSIIDDSLRRDTSETWMRFRHYRFDRPGPFPPEEAVLRERNLFQLAGYLSYWRDAITRVTDRVPADRLMVVRVEEIAARSEEIAAFCDIQPGPVPPERVHAFANPRRFHLLSHIPAEHLLQVAETECGAVFGTHFPTATWSGTCTISGVRIRAKAAEVPLLSSVAAIRGPSQLNAGGCGG